MIEGLPEPATVAVHPAPATAAPSKRSSGAARRERIGMVLSVLARHGLHLAADRFSLRRPKHFQPRPPDVRPPQVHLREALEELGTTFIKLGQTLSTRPDLFPPGYLAELSKLQDGGPTVDFAQIKDVIEAELGHPIGELFAEFDPTPLGAASIAQVHAAKLLDGREVVVKVQKPGVHEQVELDLDILEELGRRLFSRLHNADFLDPEALIEEFSRSIRAELDFTREGRNTDLFRGILAEDKTVHVPEIHWPRTSGKVITQERLRGIKLDNNVELDAAGIDRHALALRCTRFTFEQAFENGVFHADPHPGNLLVLEGGTLGVLDFGLIGRLDELTRDSLLGFLLGAIDGDADAVIDALDRLGISVRPVERMRLRRDVSNLLDAFRGQALASISLTDTIDQMTAVLRRYHQQLPSQLALMLRALAIVEGVGFHLDPDYVATSAIEPNLRRALARRSLPDYWAKRLAQSAVVSARLGLDLPVRLERMLGRLERGEQELGWRPEGFAPVMSVLDTMANRLSLSILLAAFVVGVAVLLLSFPPAGFLGEVARTLLALGLGAVLVLGAMLGVSLLRAKRK